MKNLKKSLKVIMFFSLTVGVFALAGCQKENLDSAPAKVDVGIVYDLQLSENVQLRKEIEWLNQKGRISPEQYTQYLADGIYFESSNIKNQLYVIGGDVGYSREQIQQEMKNDERDKSARHRKRSTIYSGGNINVRIFSNVPVAWNTAFKNACSQWNSLGYGVTFTAYDVSNNIEYAGSVDIVFATGVPGYTIPGNNYALTYPIASNGLGEKITINSGFTGNNPYTSTMLTVAVHELGHTVGLMHTDTYNADDVASSISCGGTTNYTDPSSVMRTSIPYNAGWGGFTTCDRTVINYYWGLIT